MNKLLLWIFVFSAVYVQAQTLHIRKRNPKALSGSQFAASISDSSISLKQREKLIYNQIKRGNIPQFYRQLSKINDSLMIGGTLKHITYFVIPDYLAIGCDSDYFYCPMTPSLAQRVANKLKCSLSTRKMVNTIYGQAIVKLNPMPMPPNKLMTSVPVFIKHTGIVRRQRDSMIKKSPLGYLTAGDKKDIVISPRIYNDTSAYHVVIYGWHKLNGKAIQPLYARHLNTWADYSHGVRLINRTVWVDGKPTNIKKILRSNKLSPLLSDEGVMEKPYYPINWVDN